MTDFTLAGPDIGVRRVDLAGLEEVLGEDTAMWAAQQATDTVLEIPNQTPRRVIRIHKPGDAALGWEYFDRKAASPSPGRELVDQTPRAERMPEEDEQPNCLQENQGFGITFRATQHMRDVFLKNPDALHLFHVPVRVVLGFHTAVLVKADNEAQAIETVQCYARNAPIEQGTDLRFNPITTLQAIGQGLMEEGAFREAGWDIQPHPEEKPERLSKDEAYRALTVMVHEEVERFAENMRARVASLPDLVAMTRAAE